MRITFYLKRLKDRFSGKAVVENRSGEMKEASKKKQTKSDMTRDLSGIFEVTKNMIAERLLESMTTAYITVDRAQLEKILHVVNSTVDECAVRCIDKFQKQLD